MKKNLNNLKITILKVKINQDLNTPSFSIKMDFSSQIQETDKLISRDKDIEINKV